MGKLIMEELIDQALPVIKGKPQLISKRGSLKSFNAQVYRIGNFVVKVRASQGLKSAQAYHSYQTLIRKDLEFLPEYFGTIISLFQSDKNYSPVILSFFEWIKPLAFSSLKDFRDVYNLIVKIVKAYQKGYFLHPKPTNFGKKGGDIIYLDDGGVGKLPYNFLLPPDTINHFVEYFKKLEKRLKK